MNILFVINKLDFFQETCSPQPGISQVENHNPKTEQTSSRFKVSSCCTSQEVTFTILLTSFLGATLVVQTNRHETGVCYPVNEEEHENAVAREEPGW